VASSADGNKLATVYSLGGGIYTSYFTPSPQLNLSSSNDLVTLSWLVPSTNFVLQENLNLNPTNWMTVTNLPALNTSTLEEQVTISSTNHSGFYRLATP
jgi:hypothetical protein